MSKRVVYCALLLNLMMIGNSNQRLFTEVYYWRDFDGVVPNDALPAGLDPRGRPTYIGQVLYGNKLIPGKIYENDPHVYFQYKQQALQEDENIKIFCTQSPDLFEWYPTKASEIPMTTNKFFVKGGYEPGSFTIVGRVHTVGETSVGKVICLDIECLGLYIAKDGKGLLFEKSFELLMIKRT
ncbi:hypothetical protein FQR65_LT11176 [Abscondita terminalis]|nr:hypothetical protein FQR65_LT11176 [Abscondita terminalis]